MLVFLTLNSKAQPIAMGEKSWGIYSSVGVARGMNEHASDIQFGLVKSLDKWSVFGELHLNSYSNSSSFRMSAAISRDLLRMHHLKRHPYYLYAYGGLGITHLSNPIFFDSFLLKGDDMLHLSLGVQPRLMLSRTFGLMCDVNFNQNILVDYQLKRSVNLNLGMFFKLR